jgi:hypothetical protein
MDATAILIVVIVALAAVAGWFLWRKQRTRSLRSQFGPEYQRAVREHGNEARAEANLLRRQKRREKLRIHTLPPQEREHYSEIWKANQARFVDDPRGAVLEADDVITEIMRKRGYPVANFDRRLEDLSVDYPRVVENYRTACEIVDRYKQGHTSTEELRHAMVCYRALFDELVEHEEVRR